MGEIVRRYKGPSFGFASRNFYAEFLAALDVEAAAERHFGPIAVPPAPSTLRVHVQPSVPLAAAAKLANTTTGVLAELNPALRPPVTSGRYDVPSGYRLRIPRAAADGFGQRLASYAAERKATRVAAAPSSEPTAGTFTYRVRPGDNLTTVARRFGVSVASLKRANGMQGSVIRVGQSLQVPGMRSYRVRPGDNLSALAKRFGVSVAALKQTNGMKSTVIRTGQVLRIPGSS
jgi:membrane-bound lytic murein transglycosylase D